MRKKLFTFLLALVTSVGLLNAQSGGISVTKFNVPAEWESAETKLLVSDLPGFGAADPYTTQRWNEVPSSGEVYLIYAFESDGRVKCHKFSNGVRYSSPTKNIWKPEIFSESNNGTEFYYTTGPSNWGPEELPQVSEITNPPSEWYQDNTYISTVEMPGFVTVDDEIVKAWDGAPQGSAILISSVGSAFKYHNFRDGVYQYTMDNPLTRNTVYFNITDTEIAGRFFYTTGTIPGGSTSTNSCGGGLTWELNAGVLTISYDGVGTGVMDDFDYSENPVPWESSKESITSVIIPDGVTRIGNNAFSGAYNLASVSMGDDVVAIGNNAFEACNSLSSITLSSHVTTIGAHAFAGLSSLTSIVLPSTVQSIGTSAFYGNEGLTSITCEGTTPPTLLGQYVFSMIGYGATLYVPYGYAETYQGADSQWQALNIQVIGSGSASYPYCGDGLTWTYNNGVLTIIYDGVGTGDMLDYGNYNIYPWDSYKDDITSVIIPDGVIRIGNYAFANLTNLVSVSMGDDVVEIGYGGFWNCLSIQSITLGSHVTTIGEHAFGSNQALTSITLPNTLQTIGGSAFYNCSSLPTITIPSSVTSFGEYAFGFCEGLTSFTCEGTTPPTLGQDVFTMVPYHRPLYVPDGYVETYQGADSQWQKFDISIIPAPAPAESVTVVFEANNNQKEVEVTLPHTFACDFENGNGELDGIIQELYALQYGGYCPAFNVPTATGNEAVTASKDGNNHYIAISEAFEGTATVTGNYIKYLDTEHMGNTSVDYTLTISVQGSTPTPTPSGLQVIELEVPASWENDQQLVIVPDLPGFVVFTLEEAGTWAAPEGYADLIYASKNNEGVRVTYFNNGVWGQEYVAGITRATVFGWASSGHRIFYTTDGPAPALPSWVLDGDEWDESTKTLTVNSNPGAGAYASQSEIENLIISDAVTSIGQAAFGGCSNISYVSGGNNIQTIGVGAFTMCGFTYIELPASVTTIGNSAFYSCSNLSSVTIGNNVASIGNHAFDACVSLTEITIPASVTTIGVDAFYNCTSMTDVYCYPNAADLTWNEDGCDDFKASKATNCHVFASELSAYQTKFNGVVNVTFVGDLPDPTPAAGLQVTELQIPASWQGDNTLVTISDLPSFVAVSLEEAEIWDAAPEGDVILIYAGTNEGVTAIDFNNGVLVGMGPFGGFTRADLFDWGYKNFYTSGGSTPAVDPAVQNVIALINAIPNPVAYNDECKDAIDAARAAYDALTDAQNDLVENYGVLLDAETAYALLTPNPSGECGAQGDNLLWELNTSTGVLTITGSGAMYDWSYDTDLPWYDNRLQITSVVLPSGITSLGTKAFRGCQNLASINMTENYPAGLTAINQEAFCHTALTSVTIPKSVVTIGQDAFYQSQSITDVYCYADPNNLTWTDFWGDDFASAKSTQCHVKDCYLEVYNSKWNTGTTSTDVNVTFVGDLPGECGGSSEPEEPVVSSYSIALDGEMANADKITLSGASAEAGETVTVTPAAGYQITSLTASYGSYAVRIADNQQALSEAEPQMVSFPREFTVNVTPGKNGATFTSIANDGGQIEYVGMNDAKDQMTFRVNGAFSGTASIAYQYTGQECVYGATWDDELEDWVQDPEPSCSDVPKYGTVLISCEQSGGVAEASKNEETGVWSFTMPAGNVTITATVEAIPEPAPTAVETGDNDDAETINAKLQANDGQTVDEWTIVRPVYRNTYYNTLCLPFDMDAAQIAASSIAGAEIKEFTGAEVVGDELLIDLAPVDEIEAGKPYFIKYSSADALTQLDFTNVTIDATAPQGVTFNGVTLQGTFVPFQMEAQSNLNYEGGYLFLGQNNQLFWPGVTNSIKPFRAYFYVDTTPSNQKGAPKRYGMPARFNEEQVATSIGNVQGDKVQSTKVLRDGQLIIIRNGVEYNANGMMVK